MSADTFSDFAFLMCKPPSEIMGPCAKYKNEGPIRSAH